MSPSKKARGTRKAPKAPDDAKKNPTVNFYDLIEHGEIVLSSHESTGYDARLTIRHPNGREYEVRAWNDGVYGEVEADENDVDFDDPDGDKATPNFLIEAAAHYRENPTSASPKTADTPTKNANGPDVTIARAVSDLGAYDPEGGDAESDRAWATPCSVTYADTAGGQITIYANAEGPLDGWLRTESGERVPLDPPTMHAVLTTLEDAGFPSHDA